MKASKTQRLMMIKRLIELNKINSQEQLCQLLNQKKMDVTQATLSRDLKLLNVSKLADAELGYIYAITPPITPYKSTNEEANFPASGFLSVEFSGNMGVIKTLPGYASSIAALIDRRMTVEICGTIAGDDTVFLVLKEHSLSRDVKQALSILFSILK